MADVRRRNRLGADPTLGKRNVLRHPGIQVVAHHQHVEAFFDRVDCERPGGVDDDSTLGFAQTLMTSEA